MKPKEFDDLIRKKFDQNDFEYKPQTWDRLEEQLEGRAKKRNAIMWWWIPLAGVAASLLMAMGVTSMMRQQATGGIPVNSEVAQNHTYTNISPLAAVTPEKSAFQQKRKPARSVYTHPAKTVKDNTDQWFNIHLQNALANNTIAASSNTFNLLTGNTPEKKKVITNEPRPTFKVEADNKKEAKISVILNGGVNHGSMNSGYVAGATVRRMLNDKVYVESDVAYSSSTNNQPGNIVTSTTSRVANPQGTARTLGAGAKTTAIEGDNSSTKLVTTYSSMPDNTSYSQSYAQVSPAVGVKIIKRMSIAAGPDFQQMLGDNRPASNPLDRSSIQEAPVFDVGFIGKTEYSVTKKIKAGVYYRKGLNDLITPSDKYLNRDYLQFQLKWVILNK